MTRNRTARACLWGACTGVAVPAVVFAAAFAWGAAQHLRKQARRG